MDRRRHLRTGPFGVSGASAVPGLGRVVLIRHRWAHFVDRGPSAVRLSNGPRDCQVKSSEAVICYLCGRPVNLDEKSDDHVPAAQIYPSKYRAKNFVKNLFTLPTHIKCNTGYQRDEDYFVQTFGPLAPGSPSGDDFWPDLQVRVKRPEGRKLAAMVAREFQHTTESGLYLPSGKMLKRFDGDRVWRIIWKFIRGLFFKEYGRLLPELEDIPKQFDLGGPDHPPPELLAYLRDVPSRGQYPGVFDYRYISVKELNNAHYWALLFWNRLVFTALFHDPDCPCHICKGGRSTSDSSSSPGGN